MMFCFVIIIYQIVYEKERHLKQGMKLMGLKSSVYWSSWFIYGTTMTLLETIGMMGKLILFLILIKMYINKFSIQIHNNL